MFPCGIESSKKEKQALHTAVQCLLPNRRAEGNLPEFFCLASIQKALRTAVLSAFFVVNHSLSLL